MFLTRENIQIILKSCLSAQACKPVTGWLELWVIEGYEFDARSGYSYPDQTNFCNKTKNPEFH